VLALVYLLALLKRVEAVLTAEVCLGLPLPATLAAALPPLAALLLPLLLALASKFPPPLLLLPLMLAKYSPSCTKST
jgi:hypothetical protein